MKNYWLTILLALPASGLFAQKILLLERARHARTTKFYIGSDLTYRLKDKDLQFWQDGIITDILPDEKSIALNGRKISLADIEALRLRRSRIWRGMGAQLMVFGGGWFLFGGIHAWRSGEPIGRAASIMAGSALAGGFAMRKLPFFRYKSRQMGTKHRLRAIEISFPKPGG